MRDDINTLLEEIEQDRQIDPDALDVAWLDQTNLFYKYSDALNDAINERNTAKLETDRAKEKLESVKGKLDLEIRTDPDAFDLPKITESTVSSAILQSDEYKKVFDAYIEAREQQNKAQNEVNKLYTCVNAMEEKKTGLQELVKLLNQQYFSTPSEPRNLSEKYYQKISKNKKGAREKVRNRKKEK